MTCQRMNERFHFGTKQRYIFGNWNKTRTNSFLEMGKSSSNVTNVFKGSSLTGHHVRVYLESRVDIYYILQYFVIHWPYSKISNINNIQQSSWKYLSLRSEYFFLSGSPFSYQNLTEIKIAPRASKVIYPSDARTSSTPG